MLHSQHIFQVLKDTQWTQWCPMRMKLLHLCHSVDSSWIHLNKGKLNLQAAQVCVSRGAVDICSEVLAGVAGCRIQFLKPELGVHPVGVQPLLVWGDKPRES